MKTKDQILLEAAYESIHNQPMEELKKLVRIVQEKVVTSQFGLNAAQSCTEYNYSCVPSPTPGYYVFKSIVYHGDNSDDSQGDDLVVTFAKLGDSIEEITKNTTVEGYSE